MWNEIVSAWKYIRYGETGVVQIVVGKTKRNKTILQFDFVKFNLKLVVFTEEAVFLRERVKQLRNLRKIDHTFYLSLQLVNTMHVEHTGHTNCSTKIWTFNKTMRTS